MTASIFVGLSTIDVVYEVDEFPSANSKVVAQSQNVCVGGPATNASITFALLGGSPTLVTTIGRHAMASVVRTELQRHSVQAIDLNPEFNEAPAISSVSVDGNGNRNVVSANATRVTALHAEVDPKVCEQASVLLVDGHHMQACQAWAKAAKTRGTQVVLDAGSWKEGTEELLKNVDTAICSADFLPPKCATGDDVNNYLKNAGVKSIAITKGAAPIRFVSGHIEGTMQVPQVQVVDTTGAGDVFHGAFCYFAASGSGFVEALAESAKVAAESCRYRGTTEWAKALTGSGG